MMTGKVTLDRLVTFFLQGKDLSKEEYDTFYVLLVNEVEEGIKDKYRVQIGEEAIEQHKLLQKIDGSKEIIWVAVILAFLVGLFVNQITEYTNWALANFVEGSMIGIIRAVVCLAACVCIFVVYKTRYLDAVESYFRNKVNK